MTSSSADRAFEAVNLLAHVLQCMSCDNFLASPHHLHACGHVVCADCADVARETGLCPMDDCTLPVRPAEVARHREVDKLADAVLALKRFAQEECRPRLCPVRLRMRERRKHEAVNLRLRVRAPRAMTEPMEMVPLRLRLKPPSNTARRKRPRSKLSLPDAPSKRKEVPQRSGNTYFEALRSEDTILQPAGRKCTTNTPENVPDTPPSKKLSLPLTSFPTRDLPKSDESRGPHHSTDPSAGHREKILAATSANPILVRNSGSRPDERDLTALVDTDINSVGILHGDSNPRELCIQDDLPEDDNSRIRTASTLPTLSTLPSLPKETRQLLTQNNAVDGAYISRKANEVQKRESRDGNGTCVYASKNATVPKVNREGNKGTAMFLDASSKTGEPQGSGDRSPPVTSGGEDPPVRGKVSPISSDGDGPTASVPSAPQQGLCDGSKDYAPQTGEKSDQNRKLIQTTDNVRVFLTGLSKEDHQLELAEEIIAFLGGEIAEDFTSNGHPFCVVTLLDESRTAKNRTMVLHEAMARQVPVVGIEWLVACFNHSAWAQTASYEIAVQQDRNGTRVFDKVLASFDNGFRREEASALVRKAGDDMQRIMRAGGAVVVDVKNVAKALREDESFFLHVHVACDFGENSSVVGPQVSGDEMEMLRASEVGVATKVVSMAWISDCLFSGMCPPPSCDRSESMSAFSEYTSSESQRTLTPPQLKPESVRESGERTESRSRRSIPQTLTP